MSRRYGQLDEAVGTDETLPSSSIGAGHKEVKDAGTQHENKHQLTWKEWLLSIPMLSLVRSAALVGEWLGGADLS
jgi:hypothetical protein